jgi:hypothetical protein
MFAALRNELRNHDALVTCMIPTHKRERASISLLRMILSENRFPLFGITL